MRLQLASGASASPPSAEETPGADRAPHCTWSGSQAQSVLADPSRPGGLRAPGACAEHTLKTLPN